MTFFFPTPTPKFPSLRPGYSFKMRPMYSPAVETCVDGNELRIARQVYPLWEFELTFEALMERTQNSIPDSAYTRADLEQLCGLFMVCRGQYGRFYFSCLEDNSRLGAPIGTGNGVVSGFPIQRLWGPQLFGEVVFIDTSHPWKVYINSVDDTVNWTVTGEGTLFTRSTPPAIGDVITADFFFFYLCRFLEDIVDFDQFYHNLYKVGGLKFRSVKPDVPFESTSSVFSNDASLVIETKYFAFTNVPNKPIYYLVFQGDGNLVIYRRAVGVPIDVALWGSDTFGISMPGTCIMQADGNLVITDSASVVQFSRGTSSAGAYLLMQPDGNLVIYSATGVALWATNTAE